MQKSKKLKLYLKEALLHIDRLEEILTYLKKFYPLRAPLIIDDTHNISSFSLG